MALPQPLQLLELLARRSTDAREPRAFSISPGVSVCTAPE
jgi:hypothetical protein